MTASVPRKSRTLLEDHRPGVPLRSVLAARSKFLEAVADRVPAVLATLAGAPLASMIELQPAGLVTWAEIERRAANVAATCEMADAGLLAPAEAAGRMVWDRPAVAVRDALAAWGRQHHLADPWCLNTAAMTVAAWKLTGRVSGPLVCGLTHGSDSDQRRAWRRGLWTFPVVMQWVAFGDHELIAAAPGAIDPTRETVAAGMRRIEREAVERAARLDELARGRGFAPEPESRGAPHAEWLALWQCGGRSHGDIANSWFATVDAVRRGVKREAAACGLTLRPAAHGGAPAGPRRPRE